MKAKDLRGKSIEEIEDIEEGSSEEQEPSSAKAPAGEEEDAVAAAYENISKKLESIRKGKESGEDDEETEGSKVTSELDEELEEWKGPRPPKLDDDVEEEEEEKELRKVNLRNLEDSKEDSEESKESEEKDGGEEDNDDDMKTKKDWEPKENDPLDEEELDESEEVEELEDKKEEKEEDTEENSEGESDKEVEDEEEMEKGEEFSETESEIDLPSGKDPQPDTLDDLTEDNSHHSKPMAGGSGDEEEYYIPNLRTSGQREGNLGYNTPPEREGLGQSYSPKGNYMEGNDPNNFFSQHQQPQAPKRANKFHLLVLVLIGIAVIGFTVYILKGGFGDINLGTSTPTPSPSAAATPEPTPTPTPEPEIERGDFTIRVLNGTSTTGLAKTVSDKLKEAGFKTSNPGNATEKDVEQTQVRVKEGSQSAALVQRLILDLAADYEAVEGDKLEDNAAYDAEVIIGAK